MVITVNRFNVFYFSAHYDKIWQGRRLVAVVIFLIISPVGFFAWHLNHRILYYMVDENTIAQMMDDLHVQLIVSTMGFILFVITTGINVVLGAVTAFRYRQLTRQVSSMSLTFAQLLRTLFHAGIFISASTNNRYLASTLQKRLPLIADVYALTGSVFLLIISTDVRRAYLTFYGFRKGTVAVSVSSSAKAKTSFVTTTEHQQRVSSAQFDKNKE
uniref:Serpentine receptor class gamma n=1 Tax=Panagrellus redivivus TaxID=6233 RepID=A0A7E4VQF6_PANRE